MKKFQKWAEKNKYEIRKEYSPNDLKKIKKRAKKVLDTMHISNQQFIDECNELMARQTNDRL